MLKTTSTKAYPVIVLSALSLLNGCGSEDDPAVAQSDSPTAVNQCTVLEALGISAVGQLSPLVTSSSDSLQYSLVSTPRSGLVDIDLSTGQYTYTPSTSARGFADSFVYRVEDSDGGSTTGELRLVYGATRIMPLGDSITFGVEGYTVANGDLPKVDSAGGYRKVLKETLEDAGYRIDFVGPRRAGYSAGLDDAEHAGFPGWTATELANGRASNPNDGSVLTWLADTPPDAVLVHAGTNDNTRDGYVIAPILDKIQDWGTSNHAVDLFVASIVDQRRDAGNRAHLDGSEQPYG